MQGGNDYGISHVGIGIAEPVSELCNEYYTRAGYSLHVEKGRAWWYTKAAHISELLEELVHFPGVVMD